MPFSSRLHRFSDGAYCSELNGQTTSWKWEQEQTDNQPFNYLVIEPSTFDHEPALVLSLSATITDDRITELLGSDINIWHVTIPSPHNDFLKTRSQTRAFRELLRELLEKIKAKHGHNATLHVFPAMPVALAVEFGRVLMPKADMPIKIYDENRKLRGFTFALDLGTVKQ